MVPKHTLRIRALDELRTVLLSAGISFPTASPDRWEAAYDGFPLPSLEELALDSLGMNELSISLELVSGIELTTADLFLLKSLEDFLVLIMQKFEKVQDDKVKSAKTYPNGFVKRVLSSLRFTFLDIASTWTHRELLRINLFPLRLVPFAGEILKIGKQISSWGKSSVSWSRKKIATDAVLYRAAPSLAGSIPIVVFTGALRRPGMPAVYFLRGIENLTDTVVLVQSKMNDAFRSGIRGFGSDMPESFRKLAGRLHDLLLKGGQLQRPLLLGTSGGGLPALIFSTYLDSRGILLIGPNSTRDPRWASSQSLAMALETRRLGKSAKVTIAYGEDSNDGTRVADWQQDIAGCSIRSITKAGHGALYPIYTRGGLEEFLRQSIENLEDGA